MVSSTKFSGFGYAAPDRVVYNAEIEKHLGLEDGWIKQRTGIVERRWACDGETLSDLAAKSGRMALESREEKQQDIGLLLLATSTPDHLLPPSAPLLAHKLGLIGVGAIDLTGACSGFLYALTFADSFARFHGKSVLIVGANILSRRVNTAERASAVLFADAAGAVIVSPSDREGAGLKGASLASDGSAYELINIPAGGSNTPFSEELPIEQTRMTLRDGKAVFHQAVGMMHDTSQEALLQAKMKTQDVDHFIPHQANMRIMKAVSKKLGIAEQRVWSTVTEFGNSSAATIPFTLAKLQNDHTLKNGETVLMTAAGAGLIGGSLVWQV